MFFIGSQILDNPAEVADKADRIITMLPSSPNVVDVYTGPNGILKYPFFFLTFKDMYLHQIRVTLIHLLFFCFTWCLC